MATGKGEAILLSHNDGCGSSSKLPVYATINRQCASSSSTATGDFDNGDRDEGGGGGGGFSPFMPL